MVDDMFTSTATLDNTIYALNQNADILKEVLDRVERIEARLDIEKPERQIVECENCQYDDMPDYCAPCRDCLMGQAVTPLPVLFQPKGNNTEEFDKLNDTYERG